MIFYHYTTREAVPSIMLNGLNRGEAPLSNTRVLQAVNLTTDRDPSGHGLDNGGHVVTAEESILYANHGINMPAGMVWANKREVRLTVTLPSSDRALKRWQPWARRHCEAGFSDHLAAAAGQRGRKARTWWLYFGVVPPSAIIACDVLVPETDAPRAAEQPEAPNA